MKSANLSVEVKRACQTTNPIAGVRPWVNRLENLQVSRCDHVWVGNITEAALRQSVPEIHHSDQGVQYSSTAYISTLTRYGVEISVARRGCPWENGYAERLIRTLKDEEVHLNAYENITEARKRIGHFIIQVYNQKRPHSALGYLTPMEFDRKNLADLY